MNINRNNYETFFLLYVDGELSATERNAVDLFVQENADLAEELYALQQAVLPADEIIFSSKNSLLKEEHTALQESLMLLMDGELDKKEKNAVEQLLMTDSAAAKEFALLQKTQLQPGDTIAFPFKESLYRKAPAKVVAFNWRRIAAAAILLGFGTWGTVAYLNNRNTPGIETATTGKEQPASNKVAAATTNQQNESVQPAITSNPAAVTTTAITTADKAVAAASSNKELTTAEKKNAVIPVKHTLETPEQNAVVQQKELKKPSNNLPKPDYNNFNKEDRNINESVTVIPANRPNVETGSVTTAQPVKNPNADTEVTGYALNTKYIETDAGQEDNTSKKSKLGNLFRKVKRIVERTTNTPSGNGVKIATFDIAIK